MDDMDRRVERGPTGKRIDGTDFEDFVGRTHGYTCGMCQWGRDRSHTKEEFDIHMEWDHPNGRLWR